MTNLKYTILSLAIAAAFSAHAQAETVDELRTDINANTAAINKHSELIDNLYDEVSQNLVDVDRALGSNATRISYNEVAIRTNQNSIAALQQTATETTAAVEKNTEDISTLSNTVKTQGIVIESHGDRLNDIEEYANRNQQRVFEVEMAAKANSTQITALQQTATETTAAVEKNAEDISANKTEIAKNSQQIAQNTAYIQDIYDSVDDYSKQVDASLHEHSKAIKANSEEIAEMKQYTSINQEAINQISQNKADIAAQNKKFEQKFAEVTSRIDKLDDKLKKGLAAQAALNGLFQPYGVGKFNFTMALGGYQSEQALAVGTGYRFNQNFAMKAGLASNLGSGGGVSYNVGVNLEW